MNIVLFLVFGLIVGFVARVLSGRRTRGGLITSMVIGIAGSYLGGFIAGLMGIHTHGGLGEFAVAVGGAVLVVMIYHWVT